MFKAIKTMFSGVLLASLLLSTGCGSDSDSDGNSESQWVTYTGNTSKAAITADNAESLSAGTYSNLDRAQVNLDNIDDLRDVLQDLDSGGAYLRCGGTLSEAPSGDTSVTVTFVDYCVETTGGDTIVLDGSIFASVGDQSNTIKVRDFTITVNAVSYPLSFTASIANGVTTLDYVGIDGKTYRIEDFSVQNSTTVSGGVDIVSGRFYHPDEGYVDIASTLAIVSESCNGFLRPTQGKVVVSGADGTDASVTYQGCAEFMVCRNQDSICNTIMW